MRISVVGSINQDMVITAERIPLKGETLKGESIQYLPGGKGANQAVAMARLGAEVAMFGCVGDDRAGKELLENLRIQGVHTKNIRIAEGVTTGTAIITIGENDNTIVVVAGANQAVDIAYVDQIKEELLKSEVVLLQHEIPQDTNEYVIRLCHENGIKVILNPGPARPVKEELIEMLTYLTPNEHEAKVIFGEQLETEELLKKCPEKLLITQGSKGVSMCRSDGQVLLVPAKKAAVIDTTGAGDTFNGAFAMRIAEGEELENALKFGNVAAGLSTEKLGAQAGMPVIAQVLAEL